MKKATGKPTRETTDKKKTVNRQKQIDTLCWDCHNSTGGCSWSSEFKPVDGWEAIPTVIKNGKYPENSFIVISCPCFIRDSYGYGRYRLPPKK